MKAPDKTQSEIIEDIRGLHRQRRYAMKVQQKIDRALESFIRINATAWTFDATEDEREKFNREVKAIIVAARKGEGLPIIVELVHSTDKGRQPFDVMRDAVEKNMTALAEQLPVMSWVKTVRGAGALGLATIIAEAGDLGNYTNPAKLWNRLGFAPYDGAAGSTWKRPTWRTRTLTAEEWTEHPFSGQRYALMHQIAIWLVNAQWIGAAKSETGEGKPNGIYGEVYAKRRAYTAVTHPDWTKQHSRMDGLRVAMKVFLKDLLIEWRRGAVASLAEPAEQEPEPEPKPKRARARKQG
jgi:hypothetical protein